MATGEYRTQITVAIIGLISVLGAAIIANWDKVFPRAGPEGEESARRSSGPEQKTKLSFESARILHFDTLAPGPIVLTDVFAGPGVRFVQGKGSPIIAAAEPNMVLPSGRKQVLLLGDERVTSLTITFDPPIKRFSLTRIGTRGGASIPTWTLFAFDSEDKVVDSDGEEHGLPPSPQKVSIEGAGITRVQLSTENRFGETAWATWNSLPVAEFEFVE